jgi:hypothetical protein
MINKKLLIYLSYPYTFKIGQWLKENQTNWFEEYCQQQEYLLPMDQALNYHFAAYCETQHQEHFYQVIESFFDNSEEYYLLELKNTLLDYS